MCCSRSGAGGKRVVCLALVYGDQEQGALTGRVAANGTVDLPPHANAVMAPKKRQRRRSGADPSEATGV
ncbi:hypothetical protein P4O66_021816 [Electrophorus voltai]|uniref:Uncharacterized protein n=1 Tax=Electrophorus voltai TaxID=2609070 RepID=A0AAD8ZN38_9TELE|nr:hypothetical protein P4O66_021816 [Electrophorus voltai]